MKASSYLGNSLPLLCPHPTNMSTGFRSLLALAAGAVVLGLLVPTSSAQTITQNFNAAGGGTFLSDWNQNGPAAPNLFQDTTGGGLGGSNAVALTTNGDTTAIFRNISFNLSVGTTVTISSYFRDQQPGAGSTYQAAFSIGLASSAGDGSNGAHSGTAFDGPETGAITSLENVVDARVRGDGKLEFETIVAGTAVNSAATATATLTAGNWYFLTATFTVNAATNEFSGNASLFNSDSNGVVGTELLNTSSTTLSNSALWGDSAAFAGFRAVGQTSSTNGVNLVDNFSVTATPEPASTLLLLSGGMLLAFRRRRTGDAYCSSPPDFRSMTNVPGAVSIAV